MAEGDFEATLVCTLPVQLAETEQGVVVRRGSTQLLVRGRGIKIVLDLIFSLAASGGVTRAELDEFIGKRLPDIAGDALTALVDGLVAQRFLLETADAAPPPAEVGPTAILRWELGLEGSAKGLQDRRVVVVGDNVLAAHIRRSLAENGVGAIEAVLDPALADGATVTPDNARGAEDFREMPGAPDLLVVATPLANQGALRPWNDFAVAQGLTFLPVVIEENDAQIGPLVVPGDGPCLECLRARQNAAVSDAAMLRAIEQDAELSPHVRATLASSVALVGELTAIEVVKHLLSPRTFETVGRLLHVDLLAPAFDRRRVLKVPRCRTCSATKDTSASSLSRRIPIPAERAE